MDDAMVDMSPRWVQELDWNLLRTFLVIAEERNVTRAAERLLLQQPTVSAALKRLEERLGYRLFERCKRPLMLTWHGEVLYAECQELYRSVVQIEHKLTSPAEQASGTVRLAMVTHIVSSHLDGVFRRLHQKNPGITFRVDVSSSYEIVRAVSQQTTPFGICLLTKPVSTIRCDFLYRQPFGIFCGPSHRLFGVNDVELANIRNDHWVSFACAETFNLMEPMVSLRLGSSIAGNVVAVCQDIQDIRRFIAAGIGIGILPLPFAEPDVAEGRLWQLPVRDEGELAADLYLVSNPATSYQPAERAFLEEMRCFPALAA